MTSARTGLNVDQLFSEVSLLLCGKLKSIFLLSLLFGYYSFMVLETDPQQHQEEMRAVPLWRGRGCTVMMKDKHEKEGLKWGGLHLMKFSPEPHRLQIMDSTLFIRRVLNDYCFCF